MVRRILLVLAFIFQAFLLSAQISFANVDELRKYFRWDENRKLMISAHRGGPYPGYPENCIETFEHTLQFAQAIIECDIEMTKDSVLVMMHDNTLDRTTNGNGNIRNYEIEEIEKLRLRDPSGELTDYKIPTLEEVLLWTKGKAILTLDVKRGVPFEKVVKMIEETGSQAYVAVITYNIPQALKVYSLNPDLMLSVTIRNRYELDMVQVSGIPLENVIAFTGTYAKETSFYDLLHEHSIYCILGTMGNLDNKAKATGDDYYLKLYGYGADILATDRPIEVAKTIK